jgi:hypothetical protein
MRVSHAVALTAAALLAASFASAQGLGDVAAREKAKKKQAQGQAKPAKVYTESNLGSGSAAPAAPGLPSDAEAAAAKTEAQTAKAGEKKTEEEQKAEAAAAWRTKLEQARKEVSAYEDVINKVQLDLNDMSGGVYGAGRAAKIAFLEENRQKLAEAQARVAALEDEGRRNLYR